MSYFLKFLPVSLLLAPDSPLRFTPGRAESRPLERAGFLCSTVWLTDDDDYDDGCVASMVPKP